MKSYTIRTKRLNKDNNLIYIIRAEYSQTVYKVNKDKNYCFISDVLRDNRSKYMINSYSCIRH